MQQKHCANPRRYQPSFKAEQFEAQRTATLDDNQVNAIQEIEFFWNC